MSAEQQLRNEVDTVQRRTRPRRQHLRPRHEVDGGNEPEDRRRGVGFNVIEGEVLAAPGPSPIRIKRRLFLADMGAVALGSALVLLAMVVIFAPASEHLVRHVGLVLASLPLWAVSLHVAKMYVARANVRSSDELRHILVSAVMGASGLLVMAFVLGAPTPSRPFVAAIVASTSVALLVERRIVRAVFRSMRKQGRLRRRVLIVGTDAGAVKLLHSFQRHPELGYEVVGFVGDNIQQRGGVGSLGSIDELEAILAESGATGVMISPTSFDDRTVNTMTRRLTDQGVHVAVMSGLWDLDINRFRIQEFDGRALIYVEPVIRDGWRRHTKRAFDLVVATTGLLLAAPIVAVAAVAIRLESRGPVFFWQDRVGRGGAVFRIVKMRTMVVDAEQMQLGLRECNEVDGPLFKMQRDPRVTRVGGILRKYSLDELPQFWNVLAGDMSIVGPRPLPVHEADEIPSDENDRIRVLPGITGMWQVSGRSETSFEDFKRLDLYYVDNWSLFHDLRIVLKTVVVVLNRRGAY